ncbi:MarP family serine protease [Microbacterium memoriense]|uniref:MarP family serine protease n=1 Tax=Microbacterium memoriense TaxID=2978350 RepID=A0ABT2PC05_9MICO|nr:MarP family serine protease [Microbacterium memoriense]MCT9001378.1 MarP family serine protease [Microbacterium memoriense]
MLVIDIIAAAALLIAFVTGIARGFFASLGTVVGLVAGAAAALWLVPLATPVISDLVPAGSWRTAALAGLAIAIVLMVTAIGAGIGAAVRRGVDRTPLRGLERFLGGATSLVATALALLMIASGLSTAGLPGISAAIASSRVIGFLDSITPTPVDDALAAARSALIEDGLPRLEAVIGTIVTPEGPAIALDDPELQTASASVARISGTAYACGATMTGSGFVAADDLVVTNAHVVAGVGSPIVELPGGWVTEGRIVYFDPIDDLAVIAVDGLDADPLRIADPAVPGTQAAYQGYPLGGPFRSGTAGVLSVGPVPVPDIYDTSIAPRQVYALDADVQPGNSGGPLLSGDGAVIGVVFARGAEGEGRGYAMTTEELRPALAGVDSGSEPVASGQCVR